MDPVVFQVGGVSVRWYGVMMALAFLGGTWLTWRRAPRFGGDADLVVALLPWVLVSGIAGARVAYVASNWSYFAANPWEIPRVDHGGLAGQGGIVLALLVAAAYVRWARARFGPLADAAAPALPLGQVFVRFGNFTNGELYGDPTDLPWAMTFPGAGGPRHPSQLYELAASGLMLAFLLWRSRQVRFEGQLFWEAVFLMEAVRFAVDLTRRELVVGGGLTGGQWAALVLMAGAAGAWAWGARRSRRYESWPSPRPEAR
ncbi:MAG: prolipoprotein diacylglyceryl transferase [Clostridia bacterium]|nr:prolipoprotein diacylglyceryl transferase [Clostridia bacterium]